MTRSRPNRQMAPVVHAEIGRAHSGGASLSGAGHIASGRVRLRVRSRIRASKLPNNHDLVVLNVMPTSATPSDNLRSHSVRL